MEVSEKPTGPGWGGAELFVAYLLGAVVPPLALYVLKQAGWIDWYYGEELVSETGRARQGLWAVCVALPVQLTVVLWFLYASCRVVPSQVGLTTEGMGWSLLGGAGLSVVLVPATYGAQAGVLLLAQWLGAEPQKHVFEKLAREGLDGTEWGLLLFAACVAAPLFEELIFRGLIQPWAESGADAAWSVLACALGAAVLFRVDQLGKASDLGAVVSALGPALCVAVLAGVQWLIRERPEAGTFATAVLFAFVHTSVWPSPVPLLLLGLGLGWLARRWRSLAGPVLLHAVFNAVACGLLAVEVWG